MSADNWSVCPRCLEAYTKEREDLNKWVTEGYGVMPLAEFDELRVRASEPWDPATNFREDYEAYGAEDGTIVVSYSGHCTKCGLDVNFKFTCPFYPEGPWDDPPIIKH